MERGDGRGRKKDECRRKGTAEGAEGAENRFPPGSPSAYSVFSAVYLFPEDFTGRGLRDYGLQDNETTRPLTTDRQAKELAAQRVKRSIC